MQAKTKFVHTRAKLVCAKTKLVLACKNGVFAAAELVLAKTKLWQPELSLSFCPFVWTPFVRTLFGCSDEPCSDVQVQCLCNVCAMFVQCLFACLHELRSCKNFVFAHTSFACACLQKLRFCTNSVAAKTLFLQAPAPLMQAPTSFLHTRALLVQKRSFCKQARTMFRLHELRSSNSCWNYGCTWTLSRNKSNSRKFEQPKLEQEQLGSCLAFVWTLFRFLQQLRSCSCQHNLSRKRIAVSFRT